MFSFAKSFINIFAALSLWGHPHLAVHHADLNVSVTPTPSIMQSMLQATTTITEFGKTVNLSMTFPQNGGEVTGTISGDCTGGIKGTYSGDRNGKQLQGTANATCPVLLFNIIGEATFKGKINDTNTNANINYTVSADNQTQNGELTFTVAPKL